VITVAAWVLLAGVLAYFVSITGSAIAQDRHKDFREFFLAAQAMRRGGDIYSVGVDGYIYPPLLAFLLVPLVPMGLIAATWVWLWINVALLAGASFVAARHLRVHLRAGRGVRLIGIVLTAVALNADKLHAEFVFGQCDLLMLLAWVLGLVWLDRRPVLAGVALGFAANLKYLTLLGVPYMLIRRRFRAASATVASAACWGVLPALYVGWDQNVAFWATALRGLERMVCGTDTGVPAARVLDIKSSELSYSLTSWAVRITSDTGPTLASFLVLGGVGALALTAVWGVYRRFGVPLFSPADDGRAGRGAGVRALEWVGVFVMALVLSPQTNSRHLSSLVLVSLAGAALALSRTLSVRRWPLVVGMALLAAGLTLPPGTDRLRWAVIWWREVSGVSWCLVLMYLTLLWVGLGHLDSRAGKSV
jgi:hypothetical protein